MSNFEEIFLPERFKKKEEKKKTEDIKELTPRPITPRISRTTTTRTPQIVEKKLAMSISNQVIETLTETFQMNLKQTPAGVMRHDFNRQNLLRHLREKTINKKRGTKLYELVGYFDGSADASTIADELDHLKAEGLLQSNRNGWKTLTDKGLELAETLK